MKQDLTGRVVAITGGARGIGLATAKAFVAAGARVAIGDLDVDLATNAADGISGDVVALPLDVTSPQSFSAFLDDVEAALGPVDILVNNAGVMLTGEFLAETPATEDKMIDINLRGVITGCKLAAERFTGRGGGTIINIASMAGVAGFPGVATYCATKFGVVGAAARTRRAMSYAPRRLQFVLRAALAMPERPRRLLSKITRTEQVYLAVDQATRDAYHARAGADG